MSFVLTLMEYGADHQTTGQKARISLDMRVQRILMHHVGLADAVISSIFMISIRRYKEVRKMGKIEIVSTPKETLTNT